MEADLADVAATAEVLIGDRPDGADLDDLTAAWLALAVAASPTRLDGPGTRAAIERALALGGTAEQATELLVAVAAVGFHTLHEGGRILADALRERGDPLAVAPLTAEQERLRASHVGDDAYWDRLEARLPGFLEALLRLSPEAFAAFFSYNAIPWRTRELDARTKELAYVALDAMPTHRYLPGLRLHVDNALRLAASPAQVRRALAIAADSGLHTGVG